MTQKKITGNQVDVSLDDLNDVNLGTPSEGDVVTRVGGAWVAQASGGGGSGGVEMNVYRLLNGSGDFSGTLINNWSTVGRRDEGSSDLWGNFDSYTGSFECLVTGVYEIVIEAQINGSDSNGTWPDELTVYGVDMQADYPALHVLAETKVHTRYSPPGSFPNFGGNFGLSQIGGNAGLGGSRSTFTERFIVRSDTGGLVYPKLFAASYTSVSPTVSCSMTISFMKISDYSPV